jgi:hypothetical protein
MYASAEPTLSPQVMATLQASGVSPGDRFTVDELNARFKTSNATPSDRILVRQVLHRTGRLVA